MRVLKLFLAPAAFLVWILKTIYFYCSYTRRPLMSVRLSERPVMLHEAMDLIAAYIQKNGKKWKIPLVEEIEECTKSKKEYFKESIWALDNSRFWRTFCPANGEMSPGLDFTFYAPVGDGPVAHVYLVQHEFSKR